MKLRNTVVVVVFTQSRDHATVVPFYLDNSIANTYLISKLRVPNPGTLFALITNTYRFVKLTVSWGSPDSRDFFLYCSDPDLVGFV